MRLGTLVLGVEVIREDVIGLYLAAPFAHGKHTSKYT